MGQYPFRFILIKWTQIFRMNPKLFLVAALACLLVDFSSATFPLTFASNGIWASPASLGTASVADAALPSAPFLSIFLFCLSLDLFLFAFSFQIFSICLPLLGQFP